ncbi:DNA-binding protein YbiB [Aromatoleum petrolei]|uniref:DNA-binding protein YbiB n=1 Tax=Aromatoleum petrolei TaxID=76116 RepID=A0ABX1MLZ3_9RHOO|nr:DNA-binding protein YbiB [Aromatoleum petrolei]NMF88773.1 DNA-binding protein YbiB [Aromatoleum petrolei]QTQ36054.1 Glycosyl transferase family 3 protein [Aromatoleum petrolei]
MTYAPIIKEIGRGAKGARDLDAAQAEALFGDMLDGKVPDLELGAVIVSLRIKSESRDELLGFKRAMDARCAQVAVPPGPRCVILPTYNGARRQANLMPLVALLLAREGVPVLIQGRHDFESRVSPFELLAALGIHPALGVGEAHRELAEKRIACLRLDELVPGLDALLSLRLRLGVRGSGHTMAKLVDPCIGRSVRVVAVTHPEYLERMHEFLVADGGRAMLMRGTEGEAYANPRRRPAMQAFRDGAAELAWTAEEGGAPPLEGLPDAPGVEENAALIRAMLAGKVPVPQPVLDQAALLVRLATEA